MEGTLACQNVRPIRYVTAAPQFSNISHTIFGPPDCHSYGPAQPGMLPPWVQGGCKLQGSGLA